MIPEAIIATILWSFMQLNAVDIQHRLDRLLVLGSVLYVAAHPDDENTQLLAYLTHERAARTTYLSLTRGDGGQNLIGSEQSPLMGVIRTHELLEARRIDGAEQMFTRARDFGYCKQSEEALSVWGKEETLSDVVWAIRQARPDVIITRFPESGDTHGHHLASAIVAREAFHAAADPSKFKDQLDRVEPWQARRLVFNVPNRFMPEEERPDDLVVDIGGYDAVSGLSHGEIAAASRSMHKSQGFGAARKFGPEPERFRHLAGERAEKDLFEGVALDWDAIEGGAPVKTALSAARSKFRADAPGNIAPELANALRAVSSLEDSKTKRWAQREIGTLLVAVSGLMLEARAEAASVAPGGELATKVTVLRRGDAEVQWLELTVGEQVNGVGRAAEKHVPLDLEVTVKVPSAAELSTFPWLTEPPGGGRYRGQGDPELPLPEPSLVAKLSLEIAGAPLEVVIPIRNYWVDRVDGERHRDVEVLPPITVTPAAKAILVPCKPGDTHCETKLRVNVKVRKPGRLAIVAPDGYAVSPAEIELTKDTEIELTVKSKLGQAPGTMVLAAEAGGKRWSLAERPLQHAHLPARTVLLPAEVHLTTAELAVPTGRIGHVAGPGDEVADGLRRVGVQVVDIDDEALAHGDLDVYDAILVGVRAFNTRESLQHSHSRLFDYAKRGGTVVVQYATKPRREPLEVPLLPYSMDLGRGRVTDEKAAVELLNPEHSILTTPHKIAAADFDGWVQERGLYFGEKWDEAHVTPLLSMADPGEKPQQGALLVADHGEGRVVYVGLSLFRQLPAGVPGAYRLAANLLSRRGGPMAASPDEPPPVLGRWSNIYVVVIVLLALLILGFYLLRRRYGS